MTWPARSCAGPQHYAIRGEMIVDSPEDYEAWLKEKRREVAEQIGEETPAEPATTEETPATEDAATATADPGRQADPRASRLHQRRCHQPAAAGEAKERTGIPAQQ